MQKWLFSCAKAAQFVEFKWPDILILLKKEINVKKRFKVQPTIYPKEEHPIALEQIDKEALYILEKLRSAGHMAYLVGGSVRDLILGVRPKDFDISTSAKPEEVRALFRNCILIGKRFRLAHIRFGKKIYEVATFRSGDVESESLILRDNEWGTAEEDVARRDFTINGLFYDSFEQSIIDYVGGYPDINRACLRTIGQAYIRFKQDPVRMIRLLKFQARFGFEIDPEALQALLECRGEILKSSPARIFEELLRMLESGASEKFIRLMAEYGILQFLLPEISNFLETDHGGEVYDMLREVDLIIQENPDVGFDRGVLLACLVYPSLNKHLQTHYADGESQVHLGIIQQETGEQIRSVFQTFFHLSRKIKAKMSLILSSQYRITPLTPVKRKGRLRIPKVPEFPLCLDFFKIRARIEPGLSPLFEEWESAYERSGKREAPPPKRRSRRRYRKTS